MLPQHRPQKFKRRALLADGSEMSSNLPLREESEVTDNFDQDEKKDQSAPGDLPATTRVATDAPPNDFDEYGAELGPEARVWKTYVKEADRFDGEKVEEWNKSLDVILIFAALFSAISTAFVLESSKSLQQDPAEVSARTLTLISQTLLSIANSTQPQALPDSTLLSDDPFVSSRLAVWINALWFLLLSLSVAVSLIAMLAKEWCHQFLSGRTGHPSTQARRRQERWDALKKWKMPEVLMLLPSLIHLSLLLFAIGLCIYLWELHLGVAIPVVLVTVAATGIYAASTIIPFWRHLCPYTTTASRLLMSLRNTSGGPGGNGTSSWNQDMTISQALCWLIEKCEDPRSVDVALQAVAGADGTLPLDPLKKCQADTMMCQRLVAGSGHQGSREGVIDLYLRGFAMMRPRTENPDELNEAYNNVNELKRKIRNLQVVMERYEAGSSCIVAALTRRSGTSRRFYFRVVARLFAGADFIPTRHNLLALRIGSTAASCCFQSLSYEDQDHILRALGPALDLLEMEILKPGSLHPAAFKSLLIGAGMLLSCSSVHGNPSAITPYALRLLHSRGDPRRFGVLLATLVLAQYDYPGWTHSSPLGPAARAERAIEVTTHYAPLTSDEMGKGPMYFGLVGLFLHMADYHLSIEDLGTLKKLLRPAYDMKISSELAPIYTLPENFSTRGYTLQIINDTLPGPQKLDDLWANETSTETLRIALSLCVVDHDLAIIVTAPVYMFVVESFIRKPDTPTGSVLLAVSYRFPRFSPELLSLVRNRNILPLLASSVESADRNLKIMALAQLLLFTRLALHEPHYPPEGSIKLGYWFQNEEICNPRERLESVQQCLDKVLSAPLGDVTHFIHSYAHRVLEYTP